MEPDSLEPESVERMALRSEPESVERMALRSEMESLEPESMEPESRSASLEPESREPESREPESQRWSWWYSWLSSGNWSGSRPPTLGCRAKALGAIQPRAMPRALLRSRRTA